MCCCNKPPVVKLSYKLVFQANPTWNDKKCPGTGGAQRQVQWRFFVSGHLVYVTDYGLPSDPLPIGNGSTYLILNATPEAITTFLIGQGVSVEPGDTIGLQVRVRNCEREVADSNIIRIVAEEPTVDCECEFLTEFQSGITGNSATLPGGFTGEILAWRNGLLNYAGNDFTAQPIEETDELMFANLTGCTATLDLETVTGETGAVTKPGAFSALAASEYLLFRNGVLQRGYTQSSGQVTPADAVSDPTDEWLFARLDNAIAGCTFATVLVGSSVSGATVTLPGGRNSTNQADWILVRNGLVQYPGAASASGYTVNGAGVVTPVEPFAGDTVWLIVIL